MSRARTFADLATASEAGDLGRRNMIINGNMEVAQRSTSVAVTASAYHTCDRWGITLSSAGRFTMSQESITDLEGFGKALKLDCTTADTSIASDEILLLYQRFEGQFLQKMQKGFSTAKPVTLSFYVKGNANATYVAELLDADNSNRHINKSFSVTTSWSRVSLTFPGDTTGKLDADNANSLRLHIWLHGGSNYTSGTLQTSWGSIVQANRAAGQVNVFDNTSNNFYLTGVQLELGEVATPFKHETYIDSLARCQRYYQISGTARTYGIVANQHTATTCYANLRWWQLMRAAPTVTIGATSAYNLYNATENITISDIGASQITANSCELYATTSSRTAGTATHMNTNGDTTFWKADSEL
jgi:hypothetical protein